MGERWTDDRMDDLGAKVDRVDADVRGLRVEMKTELATVRREMREGFEAIERRFDKIDARFERVDERFEKVDQRFEKQYQRIDDRFQAMDERLLDTYRMMMGFCGLMLTALIGLIATQI
jgi:predicted  nucleic acid-binding Zn-ribbon protein